MTLWPHHVARAAVRSRYGLPLIAFLLITAVIAGASVIALRAPAEAARAAPASAQITPARAAALIGVTSGDVEGDVQAVGEEAKLLNAALPFSSAPLQAARPFALANGGLDQDRALLCLTQAVYYEAGFEPLAGRRGVAQVVLNRMRHPAFPKSVCGVVYQIARAPVCQFSFVCDGSLNRAPAAGAWRQAREIASAALAGYVESSVGSATHYHADYVAPRWAPMLTKVAKHGAHIFYRWPGSWGERGAFTGRYIGEPNDPARLRPLLETADEPAVQLAVADAAVGPPVRRAANDVGGLLDVSKGWTLNIPAPGETNSAAARAIAEQEAKKAAPVAVVAVSATAAPVTGSR